MRLTIPVRGATLGAIFLTFAAIAQTRPEPAQQFEPALRGLWTRGPERFQRQWLVAGPIAGPASSGLDATSFRPAPGQPISSEGADVRWNPQTSWGDIVD